VCREVKYYVAHRDAGEALTRLLQKGSAIRVMNPIQRCLTPR